MDVTVSPVLLSASMCHIPNQKTLCHAIQTLCHLFRDLSTTEVSPSGFDCVYYEENTDRSDFLCKPADTVFLTGSQIECDDPASCCLCQSITCTNCDEFKATADFAARGVQTILVEGSAGSPASIDCDGMR